MTIWFTDTLELIWYFISLYRSAFWDWVLASLLLFHDRLDKIDGLEYNNSNHVRSTTLNLD